MSCVEGWVGGEGSEEGEVDGKGKGEEGRREERGKRGVEGGGRGGQEEEVGGNRERRGQERGGGGEEDMREWVVGEDSREVKLQGMVY